MALKIMMVFHDGSNYDYHFIIKELVEELGDILNIQDKTLKNA